MKMKIKQKWTKTKTRHDFLTRKKSPVTIHLIYQCLDDRVGMPLHNAILDVSVIATIRTCTKQVILLIALPQMLEHIISTLGL